MSSELYIVLRQDLSTQTPKCQVMSISNSHIKAHENMVRLAGCKSDITELQQISPSRIECNDKHIGYIYSTKVLNHVFSIQTFKQESEK